MNEFEGAAQSLGQFDAQAAESAANDMARAFEDASERIAASLGRAAASGELSFENMAESILQNLTRVAITEGIISPLQDAINGLGQNLLSSRGQNITLNMNVGESGSGVGLSKSAGQISAQLARVLARSRDYT